MTYLQLGIFVLLAQTIRRVRGEGFGGEDCKGQSENYCRGDRKCLEIPDSLSRLKILRECTDTSSVGCFCMDVTARCKSSANCSSSERCVKGTGDNFYINLCFACSVNPGDLNIANVAWNNVDKECASVCVSVDALSGFSQDELVFEQHRRAAVLCDHDDNCATPGHMVLYLGRAMMMRTYCEQLQYGCSQRLKFVNSPRMKAGLRIMTKSDALKFLPFAASYESRTEEALIAGLVRLGF